MIADVSNVALVTGCSSDLGAATVRALASHGWRVAATDLRPEALADLADWRGVSTYGLDVTDAGSIATTHAAVERDLGPVDAVVNHAGHALVGPLEELDLDEVRRQLETNVFGALAVCKTVLPTMRSRRSGRILNVSSIGGRWSPTMRGAFAASKHVLEAFTDSLRVEVASWGVRVVLVTPGSTEQAPDHARRADDCAAVVCHALEVRRPRARYAVAAPGSSMSITAKRLVPPRLLEAVAGRRLREERSPSTGTPPVTAPAAG